MIEVQILIPIRGNDGTEFTLSAHDLFEQVLRNTFGGWQRPPGLIVGEWVADGVVYPDALRVYIVAVDGLVGNANKLHTTVSFAKTNYDQLAIYIRYLGTSEIL